MIGSPIASLRSLWRQLARASEIATILSASGFGWLVGALGLRACVSLRCRVVCSLRLQQCPHHVAMDRPLPERMRLVLERLGPTFVKAGQMLALRPDYLPLPYAEALRALHSHARPFGRREARALIEAELGAPVERLFAQFEPEPFAAASLSQVHRAQLPDGRTVAVKVQRPGIQDQIESDLTLLRFLATRLERRSRSALAFRPVDAVAELADYTRRELDFRREATTAERLRAVFADRDDVVIPAVVRDRTTARVLTTELIDGRPPAPAADLRAGGLDPRALIETGARAMFAQIFEHGLFHADPHPGNLLFLPGNRVCFLDFGMIGQLARRERRQMAFVLWALADGDFDGVADRLLRISTRRPGADPQRFRHAVADTVAAWYEQPSASFSMARLLLRYLGLGARSGIVFPRQLMLLARALVNLESTALLVDERFALREVTQQLMPDLRRALLGDVMSPAEAWTRHRFDYLDLLLELPDVLPDVLARLAGDHDQPTAQPRSTPHDRSRMVTAFALGAAAVAAFRLPLRRGSPRR